MIEDVDLSPRDRSLYEKLYASQQDIGTARACAKFILKKGWHSHAFMRRGSIPIQQIAFTTAMIVSYARPFSTARGHPNFPTRLLQYGEKEKILHDRLMKWRNEEFAHSDASTISIRPLKGNLVTAIGAIHDHRFGPGELKLLIAMTDGVSRRIGERLEELRLSGS